MERMYEYIFVFHRHSGELFPSTPGKLTYQKLLEYCEEYDVVDVWRTQTLERKEGTNATYIRSCVERIMEEGKFIEGVVF